MPEQITTLLAGASLGFLAAFFVAYHLLRYFMATNAELVTTLNSANDKIIDLRAQLAVAKAGAIDATTDAAKAALDATLAQPDSQ